MIEQTIANWHQYVAGNFPGGLDELLHDDVVFYSPIVFTPQEGKEITKMYLYAAGNTLGDSGENNGRVPEKTESKFRYVKEILSGNHAVLEFESEIEGKYLNGIDMITCDDDGKIIEFKVMIRPLQAINLIHKQMRAMLEKMQASS